MKARERMRFIDDIARELQSTMTFREIDIYLPHFGISTQGQIPSVNSKRVYVQELLATTPDEVLGDIAEDLELIPSTSAEGHAAPARSKFWLPGHFKLFISHLASFKLKAALLQQELLKYGISGFVAHEDIEPTREWQAEIENALLSMDALVAILSKDFNNSRWTDQEVGAAIGRGLLVIPIRKEMDPYGFIGKFQGMRGNGKTVQEVANEVFSIIASHTKTKRAMAGALVDQISVSGRPEEALQKLNLLQGIPQLENAFLEGLVQNVRNNGSLDDSREFVDELDKMLEERGLGQLSSDTKKPADEHINIPF